MRDQMARKACTCRSLQNMNTELRLETTRTCSKHHGKCANDNRFTDLAEIIKLHKSATASTLLHKLDALTTRHIRIHGLRHCKDGMHILLKLVDMMLKR